MNALFLGEIVGRAGLTSVKKGLKIDEYSHKNIPLCVANAEGAANGFGLTRDCASLLLNSGVDVLTGAEKLFFKKDIIDFIKSSSKIIRPLNMNSNVTPGHGVRYVDVNGEKCAVINIVCQLDMKILATSTPYATLDWIIPKLKEQGVKQIYVILHGQATAEKKCLFYYLDGKVTAVIGTHTKVMTADSQISEKGTAYITDNGRCGSSMSVGGLEPSVEIQKEKLGRVIYSRECFENLEMQGVIVESNADGCATAIRTIKQKIELTDDELKRFTQSQSERK